MKISNAFFLYYININMSKLNLRNAEVIRGHANRLQKAPARAPTSDDLQQQRQAILLKHITKEAEAELAEVEMKIAKNQKKKVRTKDRSPKERSPKERSPGGKKRSPLVIYKNENKLAPGARAPDLKTDPVRRQNWLSAADRTASKREVWYGKENKRGTICTTRSGLKREHLDRVKKVYNSMTHKNQRYSRHRIVYKSRHEVGKLIKKMMYEHIKTLKEVGERIREVQEYNEKSIRSKYAEKADGKDWHELTDREQEAFIEDKIEKVNDLENTDSKLLQRYANIETAKDLAEHNKQVKKWSDKWNETNQKQKDYFTQAKRDEAGNEAYYNYKKPRIHGHFSTSGDKGRQCLKQFKTSSECAKNECHEGHQRFQGDTDEAYDTKEGEDYHCEEQGWEPKYVAKKNNKLRDNQKPITDKVYTRDGAGKQVDDDE